MGAAGRGAPRGCKHCGESGFNCHHSPTLPGGALGSQGDNAVPREGWKGTFGGDQGGSGCRGDLGAAREEVCLLWSIGVAVEQLGGGQWGQAMPNEEPPQGQRSRMLCKEQCPTVPISWGTGVCVMGWGICPTDSPGSSLGGRGNKSPIRGRMGGWQLSWSPCERWTPALQLPRPIFGL